MKYSKAVKRLEEIIQKIENESIEVDELADKVKEAVELIDLCQGKIVKANLEVQRVVAKFEAPREND